MVPAYTSSGFAFATIANGHGVEDLVRNITIDKPKNCFLITGFGLFLKISVENI